MIRMIQTNVGQIPIPSGPVVTHPVRLGCPTCNAVPMNSEATYQGYGQIMTTLSTFWTNYKSWILILGAGATGFGAWYYFKKMKH